MGPDHASLLIYIAKLVRKTKVAGVRLTSPPTVVRINFENIFLTLSEKHIIPCFKLSLL